VLSCKLYTCGQTMPKVPASPTDPDHTGLWLGWIQRHGRHSGHVNIYPFVWRPLRCLLVIYHEAVRADRRRISAESGLGTFRDKGGMWKRFDPMKLATPRHSHGIRGRCMNSITCAGGTCFQPDPTQPMRHLPGWRRNWPPEEAR